MKNALFANKKLHSTRQTSIHNRSFYLRGMGQTCGSCYYGMHNVSTTYNIDIDDMYEPLYSINKLLLKN